MILDDDTDVGYVEDGTPCGPSMMCLDRKCLQIQALNMSSCPLDSKGKVCSGHGVSRHLCSSSNFIVWHPQSSQWSEFHSSHSPFVSVASIYALTMMISLVSLSVKDNTHRYWYGFILLFLLSLAVCIHHIVYSLTSKESEENWYGSWKNCRPHVHYFEMFKGTLVFSVIPF